jgi:23S rRNA pseudouridine1911/1915/1917 synthase
MEFLEFQWLHDMPTLKNALQDTLNCSGQLLKRHFSSKELSRAVRAKDLQRVPLDLANHLMINPHYSGPSVKILGETSDYLILHKPPCVHCHPLKYSDTDTLLNFLVLAGKWQGLMVNSDHYDRGLVYRLDYETSGVMLIAKRQELYTSLRQSFNQSMKKKFYWAIVEGDFNRDGTWTHYFKATGLKGSKQKLSEFPQGDAQLGTLEVRKVLAEKGKSLLLINLGTGLRHQIRAQLSALGFPILGDELYGGRKAERLFLHALRYEFEIEIEDSSADLFDRFYDLNRALKMSHDMFSVFQRG